MEIRDIVATILFVLAVMLVALVAAGIWLHRLWRRRQVQAQIYEKLPDPATYRCLRCDNRLKFNRRSWTFEAQSEPWRQSMNALGERLQLAKVDSLTYVHGTFVGNDPLSLVRFVKGLLPRFGSKVEATLASLARLQCDVILRDNGNFVPEYAMLVQKAFGPSPLVRLFHWGSGNYHLDRLQGAMRLARYLASSTGADGELCQRMLVIGHSHAGQMFAILTQLMGKASHADKLIEIAQESGEDVSDLPQVLARLRACKLDFVTLGTPPRYGWGDRRYYRLLNLVNHRGDEARAGSWQGLLHTTHGDYVQQWGISGSDFLAASARERALNARLDALLDVGVSPKIWFDNAAHLKRVPDHGFTYLIDYGDNSRLIANGLATVFGHGIYTRFEVLLYNLQLIVDHFYGKADAASVERA